MIGGVAFCCIALHYINQRFREYIGKVEQNIFVTYEMTDH